LFLFQFTTALEVKYVIARDKRFFLPIVKTDAVMGMSGGLNEIPVGEGGYLFPLFQLAFGCVMRWEPFSQKREGNSNLIAHEGSSGILDVILRGRKCGDESLEPKGRR
jgi:hypothetical protein